MSDNHQQNSLSEQEQWQQKLAKYPSLAQLEDMGDDYVESHDGREEKLLEFIRNHPDRAQFKTNPTLILDAMDDFTPKQAFLISIGSDKARIISDLVREQKPKIIVELGGYMGYSAIMFGNVLRTLYAGQRHRDFKVYSLESEPRFADIMKEHIALAGLDGIVQAVTGSGEDSLRKLKVEGNLDRIDLLFLDHAEDLYVRDFKVATDELELLQKGSVVVADNVVRPGAPEYRAFVRSSESLESDGVRGLIMPGEFEDEFEVSKVL